MEYCTIRESHLNEIDLDSSIASIISIKAENTIYCIADSAYSQGIYEYSIDTKKFDQCIYNSKNERIQSAYLINRK